MKLAEVVRQNPRLTANTGDVVAGFQPYLDSTPNARIHWVEEYARAVVQGDVHRAGIVAVTADGLVLSWKHGLMYRHRSTFELRRDDVTDWELRSDDRLVAVTSGGDVSVEFRPGSPEYVGFSERVRLIRPFGRAPR